jgi:hypothetical protein
MVGFVRCVPAGYAAVVFQKAPAGAAGVKNPAGIKCRKNKDLSEGKNKNGCINCL